MKIKGAFPVRWAAQNGADGTGVTVASQQVKYASSTQGTDHPTTGWQTSIPNVADGNFLWTWLHLVFSDGKYTDIYSSARQGIDGRGIQSSSVTYSQQATSGNPETITDWGGFPSELIDGYWLYTRTVITYSDGAPSTSYSVSQIGTGSYYAGTAEYFAAGVSPDTPPEGYAPMGTYVSGETIQTTWKQERPRLTAETPYLWNFEISSDSRGNRYVTDVICIGNFAKGIVSIVETYAISAYGSIQDGRDYPEDIVEKDWKDEAHAVAPTDAKRYQWNKTTTTYNDGSVQNNYHISAVKGIDGKGAIYIDLDNENDSMLYDGSGNLISGNMVSNIKLYDNGTDKTLGRAFSIDSSSGVVASISNATPETPIATLTVTSMSANSGYVVVKCIYNSVPYYARFTCKKVIGTDKYELVCTPSALTFNKDTDTGQQITVTIQVYKTAQNGIRELLKRMPTGYSVIRKWTETQTDGTEMDYIDGKATFKPYDNLYNRYRIELLDANGVVLDYETIPINHVQNGEQGEQGENATLYYAVPSADKIIRKHDGTLSPATINCKAYQKTGTDDPKLVTSGAQGSYDYYVGTAKYTVDNYTGGNITPTPWWTKIVFYLKSSDGVVLTQREILVENEDISPEQNLLNDTNFTNLLLDSSTNRFKSEILEGEGVDGNNALLCNPDSLEKDAVPYTEVWTQAVSQPNDKRLLPGTWYTLSFFAKTLGYSQIDIKQSSNIYGFATKSVYLTAAEHRLRIRGNASTLALSANRWLRVFVLKDDWSWSRYVDIKQSAITEAEVSFTPPSEGTYEIRAYCYSDSGGNAAAKQTVYLEWYRLKLANRQNKLNSYCHPNVIDTQQVQVHDGNVIDSRPSDGKNLVTLTTSWKRFYMVFKTKSTIPTDRNYVLFRIPKDGNSVYLSQIKLERGVFPTAWTGSNNDTKGYSGAKPYFRKFSEIKGKKIKVYQGVGDEEWYTIVYDDVQNTGWYTPKSTHITATDEELTDAAKWLMSSMNFVATSVFFAQMAYVENLGVRNVLLSDGSTIEGGMCHSDVDESGHKLGLDNVRFWLGAADPARGKIRGYKDGKFVAANGTAVFDPSGKVTLCGGNATFDENGNTTIANLNATSGKFTGEVNATSGKFTDVEVHGSMRSTFTAPSGISDVDVSDCISLISTGVGTVADEYNLPWKAKQSGRRISIVNWKWNGQTSTGFASIKAPTGKYFFEDGIQKSELKLSRQAVELLGYGTSDEFYGWIVLRRENIMTTYQYGKCQRVLFWGSVRCSSSTSYSLTQAWYDGTNDKARLERKSEGLYRISFPDGIIADASHLLVMVTGIGYVTGSSTQPCKATVVAKRSNGFDVAVSDDESKNDGSFDFFVANIMDWL